MNTGATTDPPAPTRSGPRRYLVLWVLVGLVLAGAVALITRSPSSPTGSTPVSDTHSATMDAPAVQDGVVAYYFHTTLRCPSCRKIEAYSRLAVETGFPGDLASGRLQWRVVNIEDKGNEHFIGDYQLYTKSLILSEVRSGREVRWKNLTRVWELLGDEPAFVEYVQKETHTFMDEMP